MGRRTFDRQYKIAAVKLVTEENYSVAEVSNELSIHSNSLYKWINEYDQYGKKHFRAMALHLETPSMRLEN